MPGSAFVCILVDYENVQPSAAEFRLLHGSDARLLIFRGPHQNKLDFELVEALQPLGARVRFMQTERHGRNALDMHLAFWLGRLVEEAARGAVGLRFGIVSKDADFDALLEHVTGLGHPAAKYATLANAFRGVAAAMKPVASRPAPSPGPAVASSRPAEAAPANAGENGTHPYTRVKTLLREHPKNRPRTRSTLVRHLVAFLGGKVPESTVLELVARLQREGLLSFAGDKVEYRMQGGK